MRSDWNKDTWWRQCRVVAMIFLLLGFRLMGGMAMGDDLGSPAEVSSDHSTAPPMPPSPSLSKDTAPASAFGVIGGLVIFTAAFSNAPPAMFQWQKISAGVAFDIPGATNITLTLTNLQLADTASYWLKAVNAANRHCVTYTSARPLIVYRSAAETNNFATWLTAQINPSATTNLAPTDMNVGIPKNIRGNSLDYLGSWIWDTNTFDRQTCYFWRAFEIPPGQRVNQATLIISVDNEYTLFLDGQFIGRMDDWRQYWEYDVTLLMTPGRHVLAVNAYNSAQDAGMIFGLHMDLEDGTATEIKSDPGWKLVPAGTRHWQTRTTAPDTWRAAKVVGELGKGPWWPTPEVLKAGPVRQPVKVPFWQTPWFQISFVSFFGLIVLAIFLLAAQLALHQKERWLLQRERGRIAMDVHDDIGSRITQLVLNGEVAQSELPADSKARLQLGEICDDARKALSSMDEILWVLNPRLDTLRDFADYICDHTQKYLEPSGIECAFEVDPAHLSTEADLPLRRSLLMAIKETINNTVKHSGATKLWLKIEREHQNLVIVVQDNGRGFDITAIRPGRHGLGNLSRRMRELGGKCQVTSQPGQGCRIELSLPLKRPLRFSWNKK